MVDGIGFKTCRQRFERGIPKFVDDFIGLPVD
jgi:hypothetical protein